MLRLQRIHSTLLILFNSRFNDIMSLFFRPLLIISETHLKHSIHLNVMIQVNGGAIWAWIYYETILSVGFFQYEVLAFERLKAMNENMNV